MWSAPNRLGGVTALVGGALWLVSALLGLAIGPPPPSGAEILAWAEAHRLSLALDNEARFIATALLVPFLVAAFDRVARDARGRAVVGCGLYAAIVPVSFVLLCVHGRLVYPVFGMRLTTSVAAELVVMVFYGGLHAVGLLRAVATVVLSLGLRRAGGGRAVVALGLFAGALDVAAAYPWLVGSTVVGLSGALFAAWLGLVGWTLLRPAATAR